MKTDHRLTLRRLSLITLFCCATCATPSSAQAPDQQFGLQAGTLGLGMQYAFSPSIHLGLTADIRGIDNNYVQLLPYVKGLLEGEVNPYVKGGLQVGGERVQTVLFVAFGLEYFANKKIGLFGEVDVARIGIEVDGAILGIIGGHAGIEYFFD